MIDPKELKTLSDILALVLEDQPGQAATALEALRVRARRSTVTGGALKNLFVAIANDPPAPAARAPARAPRGKAAEVQAAHARIAQLAADMRGLDLELRTARAQVATLQAELDATREARAQAQANLSRVQGSTEGQRMQAVGLGALAGAMGMILLVGVLHAFGAV